MPKKKCEVAKAVDQRGKTYGDASDQWRIAQDIKRAIRDPEYWDGLPDVAKEALEMFATKMSRIVCGGAGYEDSWIDIEGYSRVARRHVCDGDK